MIFNDIFARSSALKITTPPTTRFGSIAVALATLLAVFVAIGPLATQPAAAADATILGTSPASNLTSHTDNAAVEVGTKFKVLSEGTATGMRFWKAGDTVATHNGTLWTSSGTRLAKATFVAESASGWQTAKFDTAVALKAGQTYVVSYFAPRGKYAVTQEFTGKSQSALLEIAAGSGVYTYGSTSRFPTSTYRNSTYWVDLTFAPKSVAALVPAPAPTPTPTPTPAPSVGFPSAATTGVPAGTTLSPYTGPCRITTANTVIDARTVNCDLQIATTGVKITRSQINGTIYNGGTGSFSISDSRVDIGAEMGTGIGDERFTATRVHVTGGNRSVNCFRD
ncbi:MAG: DUF4082 domain-containing protein, partial [Mycetocola sp.]